MDRWYATFLGRRQLPREVTAFEVEVCFQFSAEEARMIEERRRPELKLGLAWVALVCSVGYATYDVQSMASITRAYCADVPKDDARPKRYYIERSTFTASPD
jgi:hypothetical protein